MRKAHVNAADQAVLDRLLSKDQQDINLKNELQRRMRHFKLQERFIDPMQRKPDLVAAADSEYERMLRADSAAKLGKQGINFFEPGPNASFN